MEQIIKVFFCQELNDKTNELDVQHQEHERQKVKLVMQTILKAIVNREQEMATIKASNRF